MNNISLETRLKQTIREVYDFPKKGIVFKDITPVLADFRLSKEIAQHLKEEWGSYPLDAVAGIESRGFLFGLSLAMALQVPFIPIRKAGKLPFHTFSHAYALEYGQATMEMHTDALPQDAAVLIHDDLLATGGTVEAASFLINKAGGKVAGYSFLVELTVLEGRQKLQQVPVKSLARF